MRKRFCHQIFLCQYVPKEILFTGTKFHAKPSGVTEVFKKNTRGAWGEEGLHPPKKIREGLTRL